MKITVAATALAFFAGKANASLSKLPGDWHELSPMAGDAKVHPDQKNWNECYQLTEDNNYEEGAVWSSQKIDVTQPFEVEAEFYVGTDEDGADGLAFVLQAQANNIIGDPGNRGERKGYFKIPKALAVEMDTYMNVNDSVDDSIRVVYTGPNGVGNTAQLKAANLLAHVDVGHQLENGKLHPIKITWDGVTLEVHEHNILRISFQPPGSDGLKQYIGGGNMAYWGFSAATGAKNNVHIICPVKHSHSHIIPGGKGDPHFKTWSGDKYDFHGVCDLVLLENAHLKDGVKLDIHIRTKKTRSWSFIQAAAVQIGDDIMEISGGDVENSFFVNKVKANTDEPISLSGYPVTFEEINSKSSLFAIHLGEGEQIKLRTWNAMVSVAIESTNPEYFGGSLGLMGAFPTGQKIGRDSVTLIDNVNDFGQEWQVSPNEGKLFHDIDGPQYPQRCEIPATSEMRRRLGESIVSQDDAEIACSRVDPDNFDLCVFDVIATNDKDAVGAY